MKIPSIVIAGTNSGCGKTTVSMGIMAALADIGVKVQPYKVGPDYIDPMFHTFITGKESRNIDSWLLQEETCKYLFAKNARGSQIAVIEGVMGLYDGFGGSSLEGSTAHVARIIGAPVILVINGDGMSLSVAALVKGFIDFDKSLNIKGVIINNISGEGHYKLLKDVIEENTGIKVLGYLKKISDLTIESRHLGLVTSSEISDLKKKVEILSNEIQKTIDLNLLIEFSHQSSDIDTMNMEADFMKIGKAKIAVAKDKAFCFYYKDNLELLEALGAELVFFSPLDDCSLPDNIDGLYIGGGYPEVWAEQLQNNVLMRQDIKRQINKGLPAYAECGGLMYMTDSITLLDGKKFDMTGIIPGESHMTNSLKRFGYVKVKVTEDTILAKKNSEIRAHEFHYSETIANEGNFTCFEVSKCRKDMLNKSWKCGYKKNNLLAGYAHMHFWSNPSLAMGFVESCLEYKKTNKSI